MSITRSRRADRGLEEDCSDSGVEAWSRDVFFTETWGRFYRSYKRLNDLAEKDLKNAGHVTLPLLEIMFHINRSPEGSLRLLDIAKFLVTSPSSVTRSMDKLVEMGFVVRRESTRDRRETLASLTPKGKQSLERGMSTLHASRVAYFEPAIAEEDMMSFLRVLRRLAGKEALAAAD